MENPIKIHAGCGPHIFPGWINYDLAPGPGGIKRDLSQGLGHKQGTVAVIFTEHFIEHLTREQGIAFLLTCFHALVPGGVLRISTPDLRTLVDDYKKKKVDRFSGSWEPATPARYINEGMRLWGHQFIYDLEELKISLGAAGFEAKNIKSVDWHKSKYDDLMDLEVRPYRGDLIVEALK